jgi:flagellin
MALNVISNFAANIAHRNLKNSDAAATSSLNKLSSGSRVVSAKDDAASQAIGSALKAEVMAMEQATVNARQAGSLLQIADGAMANVTEILVRSKMLAVQASSGQFSRNERQMFDNEYQSLLQELDRIAITTKFAGNLLVNGTVEVSKRVNGVSHEASADPDYENLVSVEEGFLDFTFDEDVPSSIFQISYNNVTRGLTVKNQDTGVSQTVELPNRSIVPGKPELVKFSQLGATITLNEAFKKTKANMKSPDNPTYEAPATVGGSSGAADLSIERDSINLVQAGPAFSRLPANLAMRTDGNAFYIFADRATSDATIAERMSGGATNTVYSNTHFGAITTSVANSTISFATTALYATLFKVGDTINFTNNTTLDNQEYTITSINESNRVLTVHPAPPAHTGSGESSYTLNLLTSLNAIKAKEAALSTSAADYGSIDVIRERLDNGLAVLPPLIKGTLQRDGQVYTAELRDLSISSEQDKNLVCTIKFQSIPEADSLQQLDFGTISLKNLNHLVGANSLTTANTKTFNFKLGTAARDTDVLSFEVDAITTRSLLLFETSIATENRAKASSAAISDAIVKLSQTRAAIGASQNRLEFASTNLATSIENTEAARSDLLDLDVAREMTNFTSKQILLQAGIAMLAQANEMPNNLLRLFQR